MISHIDGQQAGNIFIDSLKSEKIDTIIGYYDWRGMNGIDNSYYIYWQNKGNGYLTQITQYAKYNIINKSLYYDMIGSLILQKLKTEKIEIPLETCDDCSGEQMTVFVRPDSITYDIPLFTRSMNGWSTQIIFIDKFRSFLFDINPWEWKALNPKYKRIKRRGGYQIWD